MESIPELSCMVWWANLECTAQVRGAGNDLKSVLARDQATWPLTHDHQPTSLSPENWANTHLLLCPTPGHPSGLITGTLWE